MTYKLIIFDFDGTLANTFPWIINMLDEIAERFNAIPMDMTRVEELRNYPPRQLMKMHNVSIWKLFAMVKFTRARMKTDCGSIRPFDGVIDLLHRLKHHDVTLAMVTSNTRENVQKVLGMELSGLFHLFEDRVSLFGKPAALKRIVRKSGLHRSEILAIGDEIRDVEAAKKIRLPFGAVSWGYSSLEALVSRSPEHVFTSVDQILDLALQN